MRERLAGPGVFVIPYGPVRSGVFEAAQFLVQTGGEDVAYCAQRLFFKRRGAERRICEVPLDLAVLVAERVSGTSSVAHALAFSHAVESLAQTEVPPRAQAIRRILAELERLYNHLEVTVRECEDASLAVAQAQFAVLKERLHRLAGAVVGNRYLRGVVVPGGTRIDLDTGADRPDRLDARRLGARLARACCRCCCGPTRSSTGWSAPARSPSRTRATSAASARSPGARASTSTRAAIYRTTATRRSRSRSHSDGDAMARMEVRFQEVDTSLELIREAVGSLAPGPVLTATRPVRPRQPRSARPSRRAGRRSTGSRRAASARRSGFCKLRAASFVNFGVFNRVFDSQVLTDFSFIEHSLGLSPAGCDA